MKIEALFPVALGCTELDRELTKKELDFFNRTQESKENKVTMKEILIRLILYT